MGGIRRYVYTFTAIAAFILLIACINFMNLTTARSATRMREIGVRKVLGASASGIVVLLTNQFTLWVIAANVIAWPAAYCIIRKWLQNFAYRIPIGVEAFIFSALAALAIALVTVSFQTIRAALADPIDALRYE